METQTEFDTQNLDRKVRRAGRAAVVFAFLLAFLSSVDASFFWIFLGATVYSVFLRWFYNAQKNPAHSPNNPWSGTATQPTSRLRIKVLLPVVMGLGLFILILRVILSGPSGNATSTDESSAQNVNAGNEDLNALTDKGNQWYNQGKYDSALTCYQRVLEVDADNKYAQYNIGLVYYAQKDFRRSVPVLLNCIDDHPEYGEASWLLADVYTGLHDPDSARICLELAYENGLRDGKFLQVLAAQYEQTDKPKAFKLYLESIVADSTLTESYRKLSELDPEKADQYQKLVKKLSK